MPDADKPSLQETQSQDTPAACPHCARTTQRNEEQKRKLINRLNRIEGQIRGLRGMLEKDAYCMDILTQATAANAALNAFSRELLYAHLHSCVADDIRAGHDETLDELMALLEKMMR